MFDEALSMRKHRLLMYKALPTHHFASSMTTVNPFILTSHRYIS